MTFETLGLSEPLLRAVRDTGYTVPTPIQAKAIPAIPLIFAAPACAGDAVVVPVSPVKTVPHFNIRSLYSQTVLTCAHLVPWRGHKRLL